MRKVLLVLLILLIGGVVAADRLGVRKAEDEIGRQVAAQYDLNQEPRVTIHGIPFLTQAISGNYKEIDVVLGDMTQQGVTIKDVRVQIQGLTAPLGDVINGDTGNITARTATASAVIPYETIKSKAPRNVRSISASGSNLRVAGTITYLGLRADLTAVVSVRATSRGIQITPRSVGNGAVQVPVSQVQQSLGWTVPVSDLPIGSRISDVTVTPEGLRVAATADDVNLNKLNSVPKA